MAQKHLRRVKQKAEAVAHAEEERDAAIRDAYESGETFRDIAAWAGLSHQRIHQIVREPEEHVTRNG